MPQVAAGFRYHHAERDYLMWTQWLPQQEPDTLPANASHQVGVGAFVLNGAGDKVLCVLERSGPAARPGFWKLPTGLLDEARPPPPQPPPPPPLAHAPSERSSACCRAAAGGGRACGCDP